MKANLSHIDKNGVPKMVDVSEKVITKRTAVAQAMVLFPPPIFRLLCADEFLSTKGSIIQTAIIAGTMAAKRTAELIPLCHPLPISKIQIKIKPAKNHLKVEALVKCEARTGVEMEALMAVSIASLTIYDMCKALTQDIIITETKLMQKEGGKNVFRR